MSLDMSPWQNSTAKRACNKTVQWNSMLLQRTRARTHAHAHTHTHIHTPMRTPEQVRIYPVFVRLFWL
jgi:hypothetical protein